MRYIWREISIRTISDVAINDIAEIKSTISLLKEKEIHCSIQIKGSPIFSLTRITSISDDEFCFVAIKTHGTLEKSVSYHDVETIEVNASNEDLVKTKPGISRWVLLSPVE